MATTLERPAATIQLVYAEHEHVAPAARPDVALLVGDLLSPQER